MKQTIAYDLDGVFLSDFIIAGTVEDMVNQRLSLPRALFVPEGDYDIVTGRPIEDQHLTYAWVDRELSGNPPQTIFHGNTNITRPEEYKAWVINFKQYDVFIESDPLQATTLSSLCPNTNIILFPNLITKTLLCMTNERSF